MNFFNFNIFLKLGIYDDDPEIITLERREFGTFVDIKFSFGNGFCGRILTSQNFIFGSL